MNAESLSIATFENATLEAIYWWNRTDSYYHKYFSILDEIEEDSPEFSFFVDKLFIPFLNDYSVRRNLGAGRGAVIRYLTEVKKTYFSAIKSGDIDVIDKASEDLEKLQSVNRRLEVKQFRSTISLLSKFAFLVNPEVYFLYDRNARGALYHEVRRSSIKSIKKSALSKYQDFESTASAVMKEKEQEILDCKYMLDSFLETDAWIYFKDNQEAFVKRVFDKYLWLSYSEQNPPKKLSSGKKNVQMLLDEDARLNIVHNPNLNEGYKRLFDLTKQKTS